MLSDSKRKLEPNVYGSIKVTCWLIGVSKQVINFQCEYQCKTHVFYVIFCFFGLLKTMLLFVDLVVFYPFPKATLKFTTHLELSVAKYTINFLELS